MELDWKWLLGQLELHGLGILFVVGVEGFGDGGCVGGGFYGIVCDGPLMSIDVPFGHTRLIKMSSESTSDIGLI